MALLLALEQFVEWFLGHMMQVAIGQILAHHLMSMFLFSLQFLLCFSSVINALSAFFLSLELEVWHTSPASEGAVFWAKLVEVCVTSAWMVVLLLVPVSFAYGRVMGAPVSYYLAATILPLPYVILVSAVGVILALVIARVLPVRRTRELMRFFGVLGISLLVVLFRVLQPERLVERGNFEKLAGYLANLHPAALKRFPSYWLTELNFSFLRSDFGFLFSDYLLWYLGSFFLGLALARLVYAALYRSALFKFREAPPPDPGKPGPLADLLLAPARALPADLASLVVKDSKVLARSPVVWTQVCLMGVIVLIYGFNLGLLPIASLNSIQPGIREMIAFANLGFTGSLIVAAALRFGFPSISLEGEAFLVVHSSPLGMDRFFRAKYLLNVAPLLGLAMLLAGLAHYLLHPFWPFLVAGYVFAFLTALAVAAMALDFGANFRNLRATNFSHLPSGPGGIGFLVASMGYVILQVLILTYPYVVYRRQVIHGLVAGSSTWGICLGLVVLACLLPLGVTWICRRRAIRSLERGLE
jgi:hypothetical protein